MGNLEHAVSTGIPASFGHFQVSDIVSLYHKRGMETIIFQKIKFSLTRKVGYDKVKMKQSSKKKWRQIGHIVKKQDRNLRFERDRAMRHPAHAAAGREEGK